MNTHYTQTHYYITNEHESLYIDGMPKQTYGNLAIDAHSQQP